MKSILHIPGKCIRSQEEWKFKQKGKNKQADKHTYSSSARWKLPNLGWAATEQFKSQREREREV